MASDRDLQMEINRTKRLEAELDTLRTQLRTVTSERDAALAKVDDLRRELTEAQAKLANSVQLPPPTCGDRGWKGRSACHLPAGHDGPHAYRTYIEADVESARKMSR